MPTSTARKGPVLLAVDQELGEGPRRRVPLIRADPVGADLDGTGIGLIMRAMDEVSEETARPQVPPSAAPGEASNLSAITSLVLGILAFVIQLVAGVDWVIQKHESDEAVKRLLAGTGTSAEGPSSTGIVAASLLCGYQRHRVRREGAEAREGRSPGSDQGHP